MNHQQQETPKRYEVPESFLSLGIAPNLLDRLEALHLKAPTPIQAQSIPIGLEGKDLVGIAQTGTGKTLAFSIPMLQRLGSLGGRGLILLPTRELALQVDETLHKLAAPLGLRTAILIGGASMHHQINALQKKPHVIVATPGRLIDLLQQKKADLSTVNVLVLDEADRMFDMGFAPQIKQIIQLVPQKRQTMLFSATMPPEIARLASQYMQLPLRVEVAPPGTVADRVNQEIIVVNKEDKPLVLESLLKQHRGTVLIFTRTKHGAKKVNKSIQRLGHTAAEIHSNRSLSQRKAALEGFKSGKYRVLVATDIAARGIDVTKISLVLNYDLPDNPEDYVHRIGRTGRAGQAGHAISLVMPEQGGELHQIEKLVSSELQAVSVPGVQTVRIQRTQAQPSRSRFQPRRQHGGGGNSRGGGHGHRRSYRGRR